MGASRYAEQYDGILAGNPGFHLPKAATTQLWKAQQYAKVSTKDATTGLPENDRDQCPNKCRQEKWPRLWEKRLKHNASFL